MKVKCDNCKKTFDKKEYDVRMTTFHFCCRACSDTFRKEHGKELYNSRESTKRAREKINLLLEHKKYEKC